MANFCKYEWPILRKEQTFCTKINRALGGGEQNNPSQQMDAWTVHDFEKQLRCVFVLFAFCFFVFKWERSERLFYTVDKWGACLCYLFGLSFFFFFHLEIVCKTFVPFAPSPPPSPEHSTCPFHGKLHSVSLPSCVLPSFLFPPSFSSSNIFWMCAMWQTLGSVQRNVAIRNNDQSFPFSIIGWLGRDIK